MQGEQMHVEVGTGERWKTNDCLEFEDLSDTKTQVYIPVRQNFRALEEFDAAIFVCLSWHLQAE